MRHATLVGALPLILALALTGCGGGCQPGEKAAPSGGAGGQAGETKAATTPETAAPTQPAAPVAAATGPSEGAPTPPPEVLSDCFVFVDAEPDYGDAPLTAHFTTELECDDKPVTYSWDFGDGTTGGNEPNPSHTYTKEGDYIAVVTVKTADGEEGTDEIDIFVDEPAEE